MNVILIAAEIVGLGMLGIFTAMIIIMVLTICLNKIDKKLKD